jgi:hypothetical protein
MQNISSITDLKNAIQLSEAEQTLRMNELREQFYITWDVFKPVNLIAGTLSDIVKSPHLVENLAGTAMGLVTGYLSKFLIIGQSGYGIRRLIGTLMQVGVTSVVASHSGSIKTVGKSIFQHFFRKKEANTESHDR